MPAISNYGGTWWLPEPEVQFSLTERERESLQSDGGRYQSRSYQHYIVAPHSLVLTVIVSTANTDKTVDNQTEEDLTGLDPGPWSGAQ